MIITFNNYRDVDDILKMYVPRSKTDDKRVWIYTKNGELTTKSAYRIHCGGNK